MQGPQLENAANATAGLASHELIPASQLSIVAKGPGGSVDEAKKKPATILIKAYSRNVQRFRISTKGVYARER